MKKYSKQDQRLMATWAVDCAETALPFFENAYPADDRPAKLSERAGAWVDTGVFRMADIRGASLAAHAAARDVKENDAAFFATHAAGQAVATAHVTQHAVGSAYYAPRAAVAADPGHADVKAAEERNWQSLHRPGNLRQEIMSKIVIQKRGNRIVVNLQRGGGLLNSAAGPVPPVPAPVWTASERRRVIAEGLADLIRAELAMPERGLPPPAFAQHGGTRLRRVGEAGRPYIGQRGAKRSALA